MTVIDRLRSTGAAEDEALRIASAIAEALPIDSSVRVTDEVLDAARSGDVALLRMLLAEEVAAEPDEIEALDHGADRQIER